GVRHVIPRIEEYGGTPASRLGADTITACRTVLSFVPPRKERTVTDQYEHVGSDAALRADIRRLGNLLGQTLARQEGRPLLDLVEEIRALVRTDAEAAARRLAEMDVTTGTKLARAF